MSEGLGGILPSVTSLGALALVAAWLSAARSWARPAGPSDREPVRVAGLAVLVQAAHFSEELATGFAERFPALFGVPPIPLPVFVVFNVGWLAIWSVSAWASASRHRFALFPLWFLGVASVANGLAHPAFALIAGAYFPGLVTSPLVGWCGVLLMRGMARATTANRGWSHS